MKIDKLAQTAYETFHIQTKDSYNWEGLSENAKFTWINVVKATNWWYRLLRFIGVK